MGTDGTNWDAADWREASAEARAVLQIAIEWRLVPSRWQQVQDAVKGMEAAFAAANVESVWTAIAQLEQLGPLRVSTRLGDTPKAPAPEDVRERINELIDALVRDDGRTPGERGNSGQDFDQAHGTSAG
jgi:hypothetical protein